jgi:hypothetical protein
MSCERLKNILEELKVLINNKNAKNEDYKSFFSKWNIPYSSNLESKIKDECAQFNVLAGGNYMGIDQDCVKATKELCMKMSPRKFDPDKTPEHLRPAAYNRCYREFGPYLIDNTQINTAVVSQECRVNTILGDPELTNNQELAIAIAMILSDRIINCNPDANNIFYDSFSSAENIKSFSTCINSVVSEQSNYLKGCRLSNKKMTNINDIVQNCIIKNSFDRSKPIAVNEESIGQPTNRPRMTSIPTQTPIPISTPTPTPAPKHEFLIKNTIIFVVANVVIIFFMFVVKLATGS